MIAAFIAPQNGVRVLSRRRRSCGVQGKEARAHGHGYLPAHRQFVGQRPGHHPAGWCRRHAVGHVRRRRRVPDHAVADLLRHSADGRGSLCLHAGHRSKRIGRVRAYATRRRRFPDGRGAGGRRHVRHAVRRTAVSRCWRRWGQIDTVINILYVRDAGRYRRHDGEGKLASGAGAASRQRRCPPRKRRHHPLVASLPLRWRFYRSGLYISPLGAADPGLCHRHHDDAAGRRWRLHHGSRRCSISWG